MPLLDGIVGCWSPSVAGSGYLLPDLSGRRNHGVITQANAATMWKASTIRGYSGSVYELDGVDDDVSISCNLPSQALSVAIWIYPIGTFFAPYIFGSQSFSLSMNASALSNAIVLFRAGITSQTANNTSPPLNQWAFITASLRSGIANVTLNGIPVAMTSQGINSDAAVTSVTIGRRSDGFGRNQARYGEVTVWSGRAITDAEAAELYRRGNGAIGRQLTGQTRRRVYGFVPSTGARRRRIICGGNC